MSAHHNNSSNYHPENLPLFPAVYIRNTNSSYINENATFLPTYIIRAKKREREKKKMILKIEQVFKYFVWICF